MANIAFLSFYSGIVERGVETFAYELSKRLVKRNRMAIFQAGPTNLWQSSYKHKADRLKVYQVKTLPNLPRAIKALIPKIKKIYLDWESFRILVFSLRVIPAILRGHFDLIIPLNGGWQMVIFRALSKLTGAKIVVSGHAGIGSDDAWNLLFRPDVFVALTSAQAKWAKKFVPEVKVITIPNGVDLARFNPKVKPKNIPLTKPVVICASALVPYKRVDLTIRAVGKTKNLSLLILGDGELSGPIDSLGKRLLGKRYLRLVVPYEQIPSYYRTGKVFTLASKTEAFGISYVEAMACNLPVVTTNDDSRAEIIGDVGILTNPANIGQYAKDLEIAAKTNYRNIPYMQALKFSWNKVAQKYADLFEKLLFLR